MNSEVSEIPIFGVILAGGSGTRFWPLSRSQYPKQVLKLLGEESLLQATIARLLPLIPAERLAIVTGAAQEDAIRLELNHREWQGIHLWLEPEGRNTAAAIGLATVYLQDKWPDGVMAVFPADHYIVETEELLAALSYGARWADDGYLVTFGITPHKPETGYGYLELGEPLDPRGKAYHCRRFVEKPNLSQAKEFLAQGRFLWNSGIFMFRRDVIWEALKRHLPELTAKLAPLANGTGYDLPMIYATLPSISFDYGVMEKAEGVVTIPVQMKWSDLGSWGALYDLFPADPQGNLVLGQNAVDLGSEGCLFYSQSRLIATLGLKDTIVVDTPDAILICHRDRSQEVKELV
ncbi:MAG: mannose-1-phosphate guanylyltransferase, partial [Syntrophobacterales bacterium]|nr:mannose-1-phosphate guanylyltransferase [Syntrophobacterales bacterium]